MITLAPSMNMVLGSILFLRLKTSSGRPAISRVIQPIIMALDADLENR